MKKKWFFFAMLILLSSVLAGCCLHHQWQEVTCVTPVTCQNCGKTIGAPLGHSWQEATCVRGKVCAVCGEESGAPLGHSWQEATCTRAKTCSVCHQVEGEPLEHKVKQWNISGDTLSGVCTLCGETLSETVDWEALATVLVVDKWTCIKMTDGVDTMDAPANSYAEFNNDGTFQLVLSGQSFDGRWSFVYHDEEDDACLYYWAEVENETFSLFIFDDDWTELYMIGDGAALRFISE